MDSSPVVLNYSSVRNRKFLKMMMKTITILMMLASLSFARVGETIEECNARYGDGDYIEGEHKMIYKKGDYTVGVYFATGKAIAVSYYREKGVDLDSIEITTFLEANEQSKKWTKGSSNLWINLSGLRASMWENKLYVYDKDKFNPIEFRYNKKSLQGF